MIRVMSNTDAAQRINEYVQTILALAKPLTDEQRNKLAELLKPVRQPPRDRRAVVAERIDEWEGGAA